MKYTVKMSCGHEVEINLFGKREDRERKIHYLEENGICPACRQAEETKKAAGLPDLTGSEKQVNWAVKIRNDILDKFNNVASPAPEYAKFMSWLKSQTEARWWIDRRDVMMRSIVKEWMEVNK